MTPGTDHTGITIVYFCHDGAGNVLMHHRGQICRDERGRWDIGGGALEFGHTVVGTLKKEIAEEYGTDVLSYEFLGYRDVHRTHEGIHTHWVALDFKVLVDRAKAKNNEPYKFVAVEWFPVGRYPDPLHSQLPVFLKNYESKLQ